MIICYNPRFIFIRIPKTASSSIIETFNKMNIYTDTVKLARQKDSHSTYAEIKNHLKGMIHSYFLFTFIRNPYDRIASLYLWSVWKNREKDNEYQIFRNIEPIKKSYSEFLDYYQEKYKYRLNQINFILDKYGNNTLSFIGRFKNLECDFNELCKKINIQTIGTMCHINKSYQPIKMYDDKNIAKIQKICKPDIKYFKFQLGDSVYVRNNYTGN